MGAFASLLEGSCLHDCIFYVLNDAECHSDCFDSVSCGCASHHVDGPAASEFSLDLEEMHVKIMK